jgi:hypothetical protein
MELFEISSCRLRALRPLAALAASLSILTFLTGCASTNPATAAVPASDRPQNIFTWNSTLPSNIRRVALLPLTCNLAAPDMVEGRDALEPVLRDELIKARKFETLSVTPEALRIRTGREGWSADESLPAELFPWLAQTCGCDAVLFSRLTVFRGYAPLAIGWRMRLVDVRTHATLWAGDEVFDANLPAVRAGARGYQVAASPAYPSPATTAVNYWFGALGDMTPPAGWIIENSPRQFGQYAAARMVATLPGW